MFRGARINWRFFDSVIRDSASRFRELQSGSTLNSVPCTVLVGPIAVVPHRATQSSHVKALSHGSHPSYPSHSRRLIQISRVSTSKPVNIVRNGGM